MKYQVTSVAIQRIPAETGFTLRARSGHVGRFRRNDFPRIAGSRPYSAVPHAEAAALPAGTFGEKTPILHDGQEL